MIGRDYTLPFFQPNSNPSEDDYPGRSDSKQDIEREDTPTYISPIPSSSPPSSPSSTLITEDEAQRMTRFSDPRVFGPGLWIAIHILALAVNTVEDIENYIEQLWHLLENIPCGTCREHALEYIRKNPPELLSGDILYDFPEVGDQKLIGMFRWTWIFHNAVNARLAKSTVSWDTALRLFSTLSQEPTCKRSPIKSEKSPNSNSGSLSSSSNDNSPVASSCGV